MLDFFYLQQALDLAKIRRGFCSPNPSVGALIVSHSKVIATGYHQGPGFSHAEVDALSKLPLDGARDAEIYVSLEPCCHWGRTPPCTDALIKAGVKRVVYAYEDPNPIVKGKGKLALLDAGIQCDYVALPAANDFYESYHHWHVTNRPFLTAKIALSLNGKIASISGRPIQMTGAALKEHTHFMRQLSDAILTTVKTILHDDPQLNVRSQDQIISKPIYVLDSQLHLPATAKIFKTGKSITVFHALEVASERLANLKNLGVRCISIQHDANGLDLTNVIATIGQDGIHDLWIEAGGKCFSEFLRQKLLQKALFYVAPKWIDDGQDAFKSNVILNLESAELHWQQFDNDVLCEARW